MKSSKYSQYIFYIAFISGLFLSEGIIGNIVLGLLPFFLFLFLVDKRSININKVLVVFFAVILSSLVVNVVFFDSDISLKSILRLLSFGFLFLLFPFSRYIKLPLSVLFGSLIFIVISQVSYAYGISPLVQLFDNFYPYTGDQRGFQSEFLLSGAGDIDFMTNRRYGGLYHNPNQCVRYVSLLFIIFLIDVKNKDKAFLIAFIILVYISILLSGSRTGFMVVSFLTFYRFVFYSKTKLNWATISGILTASVIFCVFYIAFAGMELRMFDLSSGAEGSLVAKFLYFDHFYSQLDSPLKFLFGHFTSENMESLYGVERLDSEWGELFYNFGFMGFLVLAIFYVNIWNTKNPKLKFFMFILFWGITSTILFSFRMSFLFMLILSSYYSYHLETRRRPIW